MGTNSLTNEQSSIFLIDDDNISLYYCFSNKSESDSESEEDHDIDEIKDISFGEKMPKKKPKSNIDGEEITKLPVTFEWDNGGNNVYVTGSFCGWKQYFLMKKEENGKFVLNLNLPKGKYQYKFKVDEIWKYNDKFPIYNDNGNINNIIDTTNWQLTSENVEGNATRSSTSNAINNDNNDTNSKSKKNLKQNKNKLFRQKTYCTYIPKRDEFNGKVIHMTFKSKSCLNINRNKIGNNKFILIREKNILSDNISYKKIDVAQNTDIDHLNVNNLQFLKNRKNTSFIFSVPFRYRHKYATFVYYKPKDIKKK